MPDASIPSLPPGTLVLNRFEVVEFANEDALGALYRAKDTKTQRAIALRVFRLAHMTPGAQQALKASVRAATKIRHPNVATTFGLGIALGAHVLAFEWIEGQTLAACLKARGGKPVSLRGAAQVIHSVCEALEAAEEHGEGAPHGALRPDAVWIGQNGVVKVAEFGVASALVGQLGIGVLPVDEQTCLAPEVKAGGAATLQSDVFSVGAITYQLLTGRSTAQGYVAPSKAHEHGTPAIDSWLLKCLAPDPANRYAIFDVVRESLDDLVQHAPEPAPTADFGVALRAAGAAGRVSLVAPDPNAPGAGRPQVGARVSIDEGFRPTADVQAAGAAPSAIVDLGSLLAQVTENDSQRWIVVKDGLDHGPFSGRELVRMLVAGEVSSTHGVMNMDTGERKPVAQWPEFSEFAAQYAAKVKQEATAVAVTKVESSEKKAGRTKLLVGGALILAVVGGGVAFAVTRTASDSERVAQADLDGLYEMGEIAIEGTAETLTDPHAAGGGSRRHGGGGGQRPTGGGGTPGAPSEGGGGGGGGSGLSYEDAMNREVEMGDISGGGAGGGQLTSAQVAAVMNQHVNRVYGACVVPEQARGGDLNGVTIDIAILGSGQVQGASAREGSQEFKSCVNRVVRGVNFPSFGAPRMGARYRFNAR
ncbi:MAG: protein kinase [Sandaracinaceae bacterium]|jgi:hypothetical protein|nr:protein kinase [Sandaracinaceae bacterium]MBP7684932.1 protein kinase [Deltaproteobacteria bacterium]